MTKPNGNIQDAHEDQECQDIRRSLPHKIGYGDSADEMLTPHDSTGSLAQQIRPRHPRRSHRSRLFPGCFSFFVGAEKHVVDVVKPAESQSNGIWASGLKQLRHAL